DNLQYLKSVEEKIQGDHTIHEDKPRRWYYYAAAAAVSILLVVSFLLPSNYSHDELFATYFKAFPNFFEVTMRCSTTITKPTAAFQAYENKEYEKAVVLFEELIQEQDDPEVLLLLGNANLILGDVEKAKENLITLINEFDNLDIPAKWYLSLCYVKSGDKEN